MRKLAEEAKAASDNYTGWVSVQRLGALADAVIALTDRLEAAKKWMHHADECVWYAKQTHQCTCGLLKFQKESEA